jgi:hypothetical protein
MKIRWAVFVFMAVLCTACVSTRNTIQNIDDNAPDLKLTMNNVFEITEVSRDPKYGYHKDYPVNIFFTSARNDSINQPRYLNALAGPNGEQISYKKVGTCCPFPTKRYEMGAGLLDVYEIRWAGQSKPVTIYVNIYEKGYVKAPMGMTVKKQ